MTWMQCERPPRFRSSEYARSHGEEEVDPPAPPSLKRGALRLKATKTESRSGKKHADYVPKSQLGEPETRRGRKKLVVAGSALKQMTIWQLKKHLETLGHVPHLKTGSACLFCGHKSLSVQGCPPLPAVLKGWSARYFRCARKCCHKQQHFLSNSPVFYLGRGTDVPPLRQQVAVLWHLALRTPTRLLRAEVGCNEKRIENMRHRWLGVPPSSWRRHRVAVKVVTFSKSK